MVMNKKTTYYKITERELLHLYECARSVQAMINCEGLEREAKNGIAAVKKTLKRSGKELC